MATTIEFASTIKQAWTAVMATANTASDGSGTIYTFQASSGGDYTAPAKGARVERVTVINTQTTAGAAAANKWALWVWDLSTSAWILYEEKLQAAATRSATVLGQRQVFTYYQQNGLNLMSGQKLGMSIYVRASATDDCRATAEIVEYT